MLVAMVTGLGNTPIQDTGNRGNGTHLEVLYLGEEGDDLSVLGEGVWCWVWDGGEEGDGVLEMTL